MDSLEYGLKTMANLAVASISVSIVFVEFGAFDNLIQIVKAFSDSKNKQIS